MNTTTTTTTTAAAVEKSALFAAAHAETRAYIAAHPADSYRAVFAAALRAAYADAIPAVTVWAKMSDDQKHAALCAMVNYCRRRDSAECDRRGNPHAARMKWIVTNDDVLTCAAEAYPRISKMLDPVGYAVAAVAAAENALRAAEKRAAEKQTPAAAVAVAAAKETLRNARAAEKRARTSRGIADGLPLALVLYKAVHAAAQFIDRAEYRHDNAMRVSVIQNADGTETTRTFAEVVDVLAEPFPSPERTVISREMLRAACHDRIDKLIIAGLLDGKKKIDIAGDLNVSPAAVSQRLTKMLARYRGAENVG